MIVTVQQFSEIAGESLGPGEGVIDPHVAEGVLQALRTFGLREESEFEIDDGKSDAFIRVFGEFLTGLGKVQDKFNSDMGELFPDGDGFTVRKV